jgi:hydroxymethylbilane synthase
MDAIVLAAAGLKRLGLEYRVKQFLSTNQSLPAVGQGAIGIECRSSDSRVRDLIRVLHHEPTAICVKAERAFNHRLNGGCQVPIGGYAELFGDQIKLKGMVASPQGKPVVESEIEGPLSEAVQLGMALADSLLSQGADRILSELYG